MERPAHWKSDALRNRLCKRFALSSSFPDKLARPTFVETPLTGCESVARSLHVLLPVRFRVVEQELAYAKKLVPFRENILNENQKYTQLVNPGLAT